MHHRTIQINHQPDATIFQFISLTFIYSATCFRRSPAHHRELNDCSSSLWFYLRIVVIAVLCLWSGQSAWTRTQHGYHHNTKVKPKAATAVIELPMMGGRTPETCWAVNKRQGNKLEYCCIWLVIYLNWTSPHAFINTQLYNLYSLQRHYSDCHKLKCPTSLCTNLLHKILSKLDSKDRKCRQKFIMPLRKLWLSLNQFS